MLTISIKEKRYAGNCILQDIFLEISESGLFGLLGENGSGKTTFLKCIAGLTPFDGSVLKCQSKISKQTIAWVPTHPFVYDYLTPKEFKRYMAKLLGVGNTDKKNLFTVPQNQLLKTFSTGMQKKAYLNALFQKEYEIYLLDEVFNGLDEAAVGKLQTVLFDLSKSKTVFLASHRKTLLLDWCMDLFLIQDKGLYKYSKIDKT